MGLTTNILKKSKYKEKTTEFKKQRKNKEKKISR
jgi:hypothetical protein